VWFIANESELDELTPARRIQKITALPPAGFDQLIFARDGSIWAASTTSLVAHYDPINRTTHVYSLPYVNAGEENASLTATSDGSIWYTSYGGNRVVRFSPDGAHTQLDLAWKCGPHRVEEWNGSGIFNCWRGLYGAGTVDAAGLRARPVDVPATNDGLVSTEAQLGGRIWFANRKGSAFVGLDTSGRAEVLPQKPPLNAVDFVGANHHLWFTYNGAGAIFGVGLDNAALRIAYPSAPYDDRGMPAVNDLVPDAYGNVWFVVRKSLAIYRIGTDLRLHRIGVHPQPPVMVR
jgi:streptogramin lyase